MSSFVVVIVFLSEQMDMPDARGKDSGRGGLNKRATMCTEVDRLSMAARTNASNDMRPLEDFPFAALAGQ